MISDVQQNPVSSPAGFWIRVVAALIDGLIFTPAIILLLLDMLWWKSFLLVVIVTIPNLFYKPFMEAYKGATLGKMACGLRVIDGYGNNLSLRAAYMRSLPQLMAVFVGLFGYALLFSDPEFLQARTLLEIAQTRQVENFNVVQNAFSFFVIVDCAAVAFTNRKRALHDFLASSFCVKSTGLQAAGTPIDENAFFCGDCDEEIPPDARFCPHCGARFKE